MHQRSQLSGVHCLFSEVVAITNTHQTRRLDVMGSAPKLKLFLRENFDNDTGNFCYLMADMGCPGHPAALVDPLETRVETYEQLMKELGVKLVYIMNTHVPCDYISGAPLLKKHFPEAKTVISKASGAHADVLVEEGDTIQIGSLVLEVKSTPGHTKDCVTYVTRESPEMTPRSKFAFTGHSLLVRESGRAEIELLSLDPNTHIMPGSDYNRVGHNISTVREELAHNPYFMQKCSLVNNSE